eukprot:g33108.t1
MRCPHANHVLQKCITCSRPQDCQFIVDEIMACNGFVELAARHKYGCRIIQRLLERCPLQVERIAAAILSDVSGIARHPYGNYVLQNLLEHGTPAHRHRLAEDRPSKECGIFKQISSILREKLPQRICALFKLLFLRCF